VDTKLEIRIDNKLKNRIKIAAFGKKGMSAWVREAIEVKLKRVDKRR